MTCLMSDHVTIHAFIGSTSGMNQRRAGSSAAAAETGYVQTPLITRQFVCSGTSNNNSVMIFLPPKRTNADMVNYRRYNVSYRCNVCRQTWYK